MISENHMGMNFFWHLNVLRSIWAVSPSTMPREEWKHKHQKQLIQVARRGCEHLLGPSKKPRRPMVQVKVGLARGKEIDSDSDSDDSEVVPPSLKEMIEACRMFEENSLLVCTDALDFVEAARRFRGRLQKMSREGTKQTTIDMFFNSK